MYERTIPTERFESVVDVFGRLDENIRLVEQAYAVQIVNRESELKISGENAESVSLAEKVINSLFLLSSKGEPLTTQNVRNCITLVNDGDEDKISELASDVVCVTAKGKPVKGKTLGQKNYLAAISKNIVTVGYGPAGTGKTYLAVASAVAAFREKKINRIILTRPAVEAGEKLGFLPGDLQNKVDPYLRPLYDALFDMLGAETYQKYLERGNIEVAPLAFMRGRTLDDAFIILDEAQNTTPEQMKMFLTRIGFNSKAVVNGDITQIDLPDRKKSGLTDAMAVLSGLEGVSVIGLTSKDVVRHELVQRIINAYEKHEARKKYDSRKPGKTFKLKGRRPGKPGAAAK